MIIKIKVYPNSKKEEIKQTAHNNFKVRVKTKAEKGKANQAVINLLADFFELKKEDISLIKGSKSKNKIVEMKREIDQIEIAVKVLKNKGIIVYPTDTVYGLGCSIFDKKAVKNIFKLKNREFKKPLSIAVADFKMLSTIAYLPEKSFIKSLLPGPFTFILQRKDNVSDLITAGSDQIGVRIPENKIIISIIKKAGFPIITTSANKSGKNPVLSVEDIDLEVNFMVEGKCKYKEPSTIIDAQNRRVIRKGAGFSKVETLLNI